MLYESYTSTRHAAGARLSFLQLRFSVCYTVVTWYPASPLCVSACARIVGALADGAILEQGSNANGEYVRFANGLQICMSTISLTGLDVAPDEVVFQKSQYTPPAAFIGTYDVLIANAIATNNDSTYQATEILGIVFSDNTVILYNTGNSGGHVRAGDAIRNGGPYYVLSATIRVVAIGKWK